LRFARQQVVSDGKSFHRCEYLLNVSCCNVISELGRFVITDFDQMKYLSPFFFQSFVALVCLSNTRVKVPAIIIKARPYRIKLLIKLSNICEIFVFEMDESHDDIGNLNTRIVHVVLDLNRLTGRPQYSLKRVAKNRIPYMSNMSGLIWVHRSMFDAYLSAVAAII